MSDEVLVSVVMPVYNAGRTLAESVRSVLGQSHRNLELLIVDDGSTDDSARVAKGFGGMDGRVRYIAGGRKGVVSARNLATAAATGRMIAFCDSDDVWLPRKLELQLAFMEGHNCAISATGFRRIDEAGKFISDAVPVAPVIDYAYMLDANRVCCATVMYDTRQLGKLVMLDYRVSAKLPWYMRLGGDKPLHEDYIAWAQLLSTGVVIHGLDETLALYRVRSDSHSADKISAAIARWYINGHVLGVGLGRNALVFARYAIISMLRRLRWRVLRTNTGP